MGLKLKQKSAWHSTRAAIDRRQPDFNARSSRPPDQYAFGGLIHRWRVAELGGAFGRRALLDAREPGSEMREVFERMPLPLVWDNPRTAGHIDDQEITSDVRAPVGFPLKSTPQEPEQAATRTSQR